MSALFMALILTGARGLADTQDSVMPVAPARRPELLRRHFIDYFTPADYPAGALQPDANSNVGFRLDISPDGRVTNCTITVRSVSPALDQATCHVLMERARYRPARDVDGRPVVGTDRGMVDWYLPAAPGASPRILALAPAPMAVPLGAPPPPGFGSPSGRPERVRANMNSYFSVDDYPAAALRANAQGTTEVRVTVGPDGRVSGCVVTETSGSSALDAATCRILRSRARYYPAHEPLRDPAFEPDRVRITWRLPSR